MKFSKFYHLEGKHAFLSASKSSWVNYSTEKLISVYKKSQAAMEGTKAHEFANLAIERGQELAEDGTTLSLFVNDAIRFGMSSEVILYVSDDAFGTADAIRFSEALKELRIHDLKQGSSPVTMRQLYIYAAYFCIQYEIHPKDIDIYLRIYQHNGFIEEHVDWETIQHVIDVTRASVLVIAKLRKGEAFYV